LSRAKTRGEALEFETFPFDIRQPTEPVRSYGASDFHDLATRHHSAAWGREAEDNRVASSLNAYQLVPMPTFKSLNGGFLGEAISTVLPHMGHDFMRAGNRF
jgi:hypothetical protein